MDYPVIDKNHPLILASASPRRKALLTQVGLPFRSETSRMQEDEVRGTPEQTTRVLAEKKAREVFSRVGNFWVLGTDTVVVVDQNTSEIPKPVILGKPNGKADADRMLRLISGREHRVVSGFCILDPSGRTAHSEAVATKVQIKVLSDEEIKAYVLSEEPFDKAGGYAIQGIGSFMVREISGSYTNVVGLPLYALIKALVAVKALNGFP